MPSRNGYKEKVVLITGGSQGIGKELAAQVLAHGGSVVITGRDTDKLQHTLQGFAEFGDRIWGTVSDTSVPGDAETLVSKTLEKFGRLDVVICNAGVTAYGDITKTSPGVVDQMIDTNLKGAMYISIAASDAIKSSKGAILFISSIAGLRGIPKYGLYSISKMGLTALAQCLRFELKPYGAFSGIAYVFFTENESHKQTIHVDGSLKDTPLRDPRFLRARDTTARLLLEQIMHRKPVSVHTFTGWLTYQMARFFPRVLHMLYSIYYMRENKK